MNQEFVEIIPSFDGNSNGILEDKEREAARKYIRDKRGSQGQSFSSSPSLSAKSDIQDDLLASIAAAPEEPAALYDEKTLRTFYLRFSESGRYNELTDFYRTDVDVPALLIVDGKIYSSVGVHFRGSSSYFTTGDSLKKSFNISIDHGKEDQRLYGYRTLNLLNSHADPSFIREVLFSRITRRYVSAPKADFVKLVINGENWGST